jgi:hypothetical protein
MAELALVILATFDVVDPRKFRPLVNEFESNCSSPF